jgi:O-antigen ligase
MLAVWIFTLLVILSVLFQRPVISRDQLRIILLPVLLFLWYLISWILNGFSGPGYDEMISKSALIMLPLLLLLSQNMKGVDLVHAMRGFILALMLSGIHLLLRAILLSLSGYDMKEWAYHGFTAPYESGAIYYSWYVSIALLYILFGRKDPVIWKFRSYLIPFFLLLLMAAASKLFIVIMIPVLIWYFIRRSPAGRYKWLVMVVISLIILGGAFPVSYRLQELKTFDSEIVFQDQYAYDTPLNGITLRLIQWRLGAEIIQEENLWLIGAGPGNGQELLDRKYVEYGLYAGNEELGDSGYLGYNFHNQYIETLVETGLPGLILLLLLLAGAALFYKKLLIFPKVVFLVTILFLLTESVLERQAGILVFSMLIAFAPAGENYVDKKLNE